MTKKNLQKAGPTVFYWWCQLSSHQIWVYYTVTRCNVCFTLYTKQIFYFTTSTALITLKIWVIRLFSISMKHLPHITANHLTINTKKNTNRDRSVLGNGFIALHFGNDNIEWSCLTPMSWQAPTSLWEPWRGIAKPSNYYAESNCYN